jgi:glycosyltransferase involved in cell wall biosynthesis
MEEKKLKILFGCLFYREFTGSEMYVFELCKNFVKDGHDVTVVSPSIEGPLRYLSESLGIKVYDFNNVPVNENFDIIHGQHYPVVDILVNAFPNTPIITTIHSEIIDLENPVLSEKIKKYICIRPEIKKYVIDKFGINESLTDVIYNPVDENRFNLIDTENSNSILFVGTIDYLRKNSIFDIAEHCEENKKELWIVGKNHSNYLNELISKPHVKYFNETNKVEQFTKKCGETAGILLGRTTIEGWMCGKPGWIYDIDNNGKILGKKLHEIPSDVEKYYSMNVSKKIKEQYIKILNQ